jgi:ankyrin repeat protein
MVRELNDLSLPLSFSGETLDEFHKWFHKNRENRELLKESVNFKDESNNTILHQLVPINPPSALVESIIQVAPDTVEVQNNRGYLPLHEACWSKASPNVVAMLIQSYPKATEVKDEEGMLPLHLACLKCGSPDVIRILLQAYPRAAEAQDNSGSLPIHYLPCSEGSHNVLDMLLCAYPNGAKEQNNDGMLPLHLACIKRANSEVIQILLEAYPKAAEIQDYRGLLPLQYARNNGASPDILKILFDAFQKSLIENISAYREAELLAICFRVAVGVASISDVNQWLNENNDNPLLLQEAANFKDENNNTPLHRLVAACPPVDLVDRLLQLAPNAIMERNNYNCMPLHVACFNNASLDVVKKLLEAHPKAAEVAEKDGRLPLHIALLKNASFNVMRVLLETYPQSLQKKDKRGRKAAELRDHNGKLLLHHACCNGLSMDLMQMVVEAYTEGCTIKDNLGSQPWQLLKTNGAAARRDEGGMYPLHHACRKKASLHFLKLLLDAYPECIAKVDDYGKTPSQLLEESGVAAQPDENDNDRLLLHSVCSDFSNEESTINLAIFLKLIITAYPKGKNILDRDHMTPLHHACACANSVEALRCLVTILVEDEREPSINAKDKYGRTPLCILMKRTDPTTLDISSRNCSEIVDSIVSSKVVEYLVKRGANIYFADKEKKQVRS